MVKESGDGVLSKLTSLINKHKDSPNVRLVIKRINKYDKLCYKKKQAVIKSELAAQQSREGPEERGFDLAVRFKAGNKKGTATVGCGESKGFTQSLINIFRLNIFEQQFGKKAKARSRSAKNVVSKTTTKERDRLKKIKKMITRRKEEQKKKKAWRDYLFRLAKGKLEKGEKPPQ